MITPVPTAASAATKTVAGAHPELLAGPPPPQGGGGGAPGPPLTRFTFPTTKRGAAAESQQFNFTNGGSAPLRITAAGLSSPTAKFWTSTIDDLIGQLVQPGQSITFTVTFTPPKT